MNFNTDVKSNLLCYRLHPSILNQLMYQFNEFIKINSWDTIIANSDISFMADKLDSFFKKNWLLLETMK